MDFYIKSEHQTESVFFSSPDDANRLFIDGNLVCHFWGSYFFEFQRDDTEIISYTKKQHIPIALPF